MILSQQMYIMKDERDWTQVTMSLLPSLMQDGAVVRDSRELQVMVELPGGVGVSLVSSSPAEELLYAHFSGITMELTSTSSQQKLSLLVRDVQCDNQLFEAQCPVLVYVAPPSARSRDAEAQRSMPALRIAAERSPSLNSNVASYKVCQQKRAFCILELSSLTTMHYKNPSRYNDS